MSLYLDSEAVDMHDYIRHNHTVNSYSIFTDLFDQVQLNILWRLREDLTVPAPHHITLGHCPVSHTGHQEPCLITATADLTATSRLHPDSAWGFMNKVDYIHSSTSELVSAVTVHECDWVWFNNSQVLMNTSWMGLQLTQISGTSCLQCASVGL